MRYHELTELAGVKKFSDMTSKEVIDYFTQGRGPSAIKILGQGALGAAVQIGEDVYKFWMLDSAYTDYVRFCQKHPDNPFLPKFKSDIKKMPAFFVRHENAPDYVHYIKMEKLTSVRSDFEMQKFWFNIKQESDDEDQHICDYVTLGTLIAFAEAYNDTGETPSEKFLNSYGQYLNNGHQYTSEEVGKEVLLLIETMCSLHQFGHTLDLHDGNFMKRGDQLVILDPIANMDDLKLNREFSRFDDKLFRDDGEGKPAVTSKTRTK